MSQRKFNRYHYNTKQENLWGCCQDERGGVGRDDREINMRKTKTNLNLSLFKIFCFFCKNKVETKKNRNFGKYILKQNSEADENTTHKTRRLNLK